LLLILEVFTLGPKANKSYALSGNFILDLSSSNDRINNKPKYPRGQGHLWEIFLAVKRLTLYVLYGQSLPPGFSIEKYSLTNSKN